MSNRLWLELIGISSFIISLYWGGGDLSNARNRIVARTKSPLSLLRVRSHLSWKCWKVCVGVRNKSSEEFEIQFDLLFLVQRFFYRMKPFLVREINFIKTINTVSLWLDYLVIHGGIMTLVHSFKLYKNNCPRLRSGPVLMDRFKPFKNGLSILSPDDTRYFQVPNSTKP